jgi:hypothetical protein
MGAATDALGDGISAVASAPKLIVAAYFTFAVGGLAAVVMLVLSIIPILGQLAGGFGIQAVVIPLGLAGLLTMADAVRDGGTRFGNYADGIRSNAWTLIAAYAIRYAARVVAMFVGIGLLLGVTLTLSGPLVRGLYGSIPSEAVGLTGNLALLTGANVLVLSLFFLVFFLPFLLLGYVFLFVDVAVVFGDADATGAFRRSWDLVREDPVSSLGYYLLRLLVFVVAFVVPYQIGSTVGSLAASGVDETVLLSIGGGLAGIVVVGPLGTAVAVAYHAAYFRRRTTASE